MIQHVVIINTVHVPFCPPLTQNTPSGIGQKGTEESRMDKKDKKGHKIPKMQKSSIFLYFDKGKNGTKRDEWG